MQKVFPETKLFISGAWQTVSKWEIAEPTQHRPPIPEPLVLAMASLAIGWGWRKFSAVLLLAFYGILRIGEALSAKRSDLLLPADLLSQDKVAYLLIRSPKTRRRGASTQYATVVDGLVVEVMEATWKDLPKDSMLFPMTPGAFRRRWDALLAALRISKVHRLTPGGCRGGGAVAAHRKGTHINDLMWRMRLQHQRTLSYYLQEVTAASILPCLPESTRSDVALLRDAFPIFVRMLQWRTD